MTICEMKSEHIRDVAKIERTCFSLPWTEQAFANCLNDKRYYTLVAIEQGEVCGFISCTVILDEGYINNIAVLPQMRRQGIAEALLLEAMAYAKARRLAFWTLEVRCSNISAISLYKKLGFKKIGVRKGFYQLPKEDADIMTLELSEETQL